MKLDRVYKIMVDRNFDIKNVSFTLVEAGEPEEEKFTQEDIMLLILSMQRQIEELANKVNKL